eukprot:5678742-Lingulodinium_polyedra.AAC.1
MSPSGSKSGLPSRPAEPQVRKLSAAGSGGTGRRCAGMSPRPHSAGASSHCSMARGCSWLARAKATEPMASSSCALPGHCQMQCLRLSGAAPHLGHKAVVAKCAATLRSIVQTAAATTA